jgi:tetratricopeptide (TPR) repeat protein
MTGHVRLAAATFFLILFTYHSGAQEAVTPPWVLYEQGTEQLSTGRYGEALRSFRAAASARHPFPEADFGIGRIFQAEGAYDLALRHYNVALQHAHVLEVPDTAFLIRYQKAEVLRLSGDQEGFESMLRGIALSEPGFAEASLADRREAYLSVLRSQGLDRLLVLYRMNDGFSHRAHRDLGVHLVDTGRCRDALMHLTFAVMKGLSTLAAEVGREEFDYTYSTAASLIAQSLERRHLTSYIDREELFRSLFYLALALECDSPDSATSATIWRLLASQPAAGQWHRRALQRIPGPLLRRR